MLCYAVQLYTANPMSRNPILTSRHLCSLSAEDIRISSIEDSHGGASEELSTGSSEFNLLYGEQMYYPPKSKRLFRRVGQQRGL
jgi:hypothetical protein